MGFTLLEAMACGTPAICSRVAAMPEFVENAKTGFIFDNPAQLGRQLRTLAENPKLVETMGLQARCTVEQQFSLRVAGRKMFELYRNLDAERSEAAA
jgi:glycosyltransferase involved in cell wall biosynthesis